MRLVYVKGKYAFIAYLDAQTIKQLKTRSLLGQHQVVLEQFPLLITNPDEIPEGGEIKWTAWLDDTHLIKMSVPIAEDIMDWVTPTTNDMAIVIHIMESPWKF